VRNFTASASSITWSDVSGVIRSSFEKEVQENVLKLDGKLDTKAVQFDTSTTNKEFGIQWKGFEEQVRSVVVHYLEVKAKGQK